jgi:hypothetical protein
MTPDYRALCAELEDAYTWCIEEYMTAPAEEDTLIQRARAALEAQPEPAAPTDEALDRFADEVWSGSPRRYARAVLARWGTPPPQPVWADIHYAWELLDAEGDWQAGGSANSLEDVQREGNRYLQTYAQDGSHKLIIQRHCVSTIEEVTND